MKILVPCALLAVVSFTVPVLTLDQSAEACGTYEPTPRLTADDAVVAARLLERDIRQRLTKSRPPAPTPRFMSRAGPRHSERKHTVAIGMIDLPRAGDAFATPERRIVSGEITLSLTTDASVATRYRANLDADTVELRDGDEWVPVRRWRVADDDAKNE